MFARFKWSLINYAQKMEKTCSLMEGVRSVVLSPNREAFDRYFGCVWEVVHTLTVAVLSQSEQSSGPDELKRFKSYLEAVGTSKTSRDTRLGRGQVRDQSLPSCDKFNPSPSFHFWYCIFAKVSL